MNISRNTSICSKIHKQIDSIIVRTRKEYRNSVEEIISEQITEVCFGKLRSRQACLYDIKTRIELPIFNEACGFE